MKAKALLEICCGSATDAIEAWQGGAWRVELCSALFLGGLTPSLASLLEVKDKTSVQVATMVRPRQGGFFYSETDFRVVLQDASLFVKHGADALVGGFLLEDGRVDLSRCKALVDVADGVPVCFHRAFDLVPDWREALDVLVEAGVKRVLTSGLALSAWDGRETLRQMVEYAGDRLTIMPGGGIRSHHIREILAFTGAKEVHCGGVSETLIDPSNQHQPGLRFGDPLSPPENEYRQVSAEKVRALVDALTEDEK